MTNSISLVRNHESYENSDKICCQIRIYGLNVSYLLFNPVEFRGAQCIMGSHPEKYVPEVDSKECRVYQILFARR